MADKPNPRGASHSATVRALADLTRDNGSRRCELVVTEHRTRRREVIDPAHVREWLSSYWTERLDAFKEHLEKQQ